MATSKLPIFAACYVPTLTQTKFQKHFQFVKGTTISYRTPMIFYTRLQLIMVIVTRSISPSISISKHCGEKQRITKPLPPIYIDSRIYPCSWDMQCRVELHFTTIFVISHLETDFFGLKFWKSMPSLLGAFN